MLGDVQLLGRLARVMECRGGRQQGQGGPENGQVQMGGVEGQKEQDIPGWVLTVGGGRRPRPTEQNNG